MGSLRDVVFEPLDLSLFYLVIIAVKVSQSGRAKEGEQQVMSIRILVVAKAEPRVNVNGKTEDINTGKAVRFNHVN